MKDEALLRSMRWRGGMIQNRGLSAGEGFWYHGRVLNDLRAVGWYKEELSS